MLSLVSLLLRLEREKWGYKFGSNPEDGGRVYRARVWRPDELGGGKEVEAATPEEALNRALADAERRRRNRRRHLHQRRQTALAQQAVAP